ncbi:alpha-amylase family glycosyl hydrolase [Actinoplanes sp. KI2]|uniref:alpha-amylase family glycosyl hydrolase n=1 Tax=Actinoplanes sp. KI2 TaxID=2983315 RepID=UPI0021D5E162|nr:alpha-amylase family glycosyl hydrolase [Actinoplanes sp. KI2]MCU7723763.1 alpha-amylase family glycosyl hydrolase [Actinoplanes sp. KI2]
MRWSDYAIWWHVYPLGFLSAEEAERSPGTPVEHRLPELANRLDHLLELGCNGLALGPVFAAETHGYDTVDHFRVDPRLGDEDDLVTLIEKASAKGVRVLLDGVFNHVSRSFAHRDWFVREGDDYRTFEGHHRLVTLDHANPAVADYVTDVLGYWLDRGVSGWRFDAAYAVPLPFWRTVTDRARAKHPDAWFVGEVIHGDYRSYVTEGGLDSVTQYELWKAIWSSLNDVNPHELAWALGRHNELLATFAPQTFVGNHDVTRIASRLTDARHLPHALAVLFTVGGIPSVYYGDERAWRGVKQEREGGDDAIRPAFPDDLGDDGLDTQRLHQQLIGIRRRHPWLVRAATEIHSLGNGVLSYTLAGPDDAAVAVALNFGDVPARAELPHRPWRPEAGSPTADLPPYGWMVATV